MNALRVDCIQTYADGQMRVYAMEPGEPIRYRDGEYHESARLMWVVCDECIIKGQPLRSPEMLGYEAREWRMAHNELFHNSAIVGNTDASYFLDLVRRRMENAHAQYPEPIPVGDGYVA